MIITQNIRTQRRVTRSQGETDLKVLDTEDWF